VGRLERQQKRLGAQRENRRRQRMRRGVPVLSIVGYTNAGKSTLLQRLTHTRVLMGDKMFATLDPVSRRLRFPREREVIVTDTVGFIRDLPADLTSAFRATLEELDEASALLHVVDVSAPDFERRIEAVRKVLGELGLDETPELLVFNQIDKLPDGGGEVIARRLEGVAISALDQRGLAELLKSVETLLFEEGLSEHSMRHLQGVAR
jgi:GTP-binding protein HflX